LAVFEAERKMVGDVEKIGLIKDYKMYACFNSPRRGGSPLEKVRSGRLA
jgi:hypothetical protein